LLFYLQGAGRTGLATDATGASRITNEETSLFIQDQWRAGARVTLQYGLRWDAQLMPATVDPTTTAFARFLKDPRFPSDGTIPDQKAMWQPRVGATWDVRGNGRSVLRASAGVYFARQNMLSQVGSVTTNGLQQQSIFVSTDNIRQFGAAPPTWPGVLTPAPVAPGEFPLFTGVRVFSRDYKNPRTYTFNAGYEQELIPDLAGYVDYTYAAGRQLTRFINYNRADAGSPFSPFLDETMVTTSLGRSNYNGLTLGLRKRFSKGYQLEANYVLSQDKDDDSNERDPFTDRAFNFNNLSLDYALSDRDIRNKFNLFGYFQIPVEDRDYATIPAAASSTSAALTICGRRSGTQHAAEGQRAFSFDWRLSGRSASAAVWNWCRPPRCSTRSTTPITSTRFRRRRSSISMDSRPAWAIPGRCSWRSTDVLSADEKIAVWLISRVETHARTRSRVPFGGL
jgi:hypothetical protein